MSDRACGPWRRCCTRHAAATPRAIRRVAVHRARRQPASPKSIRTCMLPGRRGSRLHIACAMGVCSSGSAKKERARTGGVVAGDARDTAPGSAIEDTRRVHRRQGGQPLRNSRGISGFDTFESIVASGPKQLKTQASLLTLGQSARGKAPRASARASERGHDRVAVPKGPSVRNRLPTLD